MLDPFFYPHTLYVEENGEFIEKQKCRDQPNSKGAIITAGEKIDYKFQSLVFIPKDNFLYLIPGQTVRIVGEFGEKRLEGRIARYSLDGLEDNRLWI